MKSGKKKILKNPKNLKNQKSNQKVQKVQKEPPKQIYFNIDGFNEPYQDILSKLIFISKIREGDMIHVSSLTITETDIFTRFSRTVENWYNKTFSGTPVENRHHTLRFFYETIYKGFTLAEEYIKKEENFYKKIGETILDAIHNSRKGLINSKKTYEDKKDIWFTSNIEALLITMDTKVAQMSDKERDNLDNSENVIGEYTY